MRRVAGRILRLAKRIVRAIIKIPRFIWAIARLFVSRIRGRDKTPAIGLVVDSFNHGGLENVVLNLYHGYRSKGYPAYVISVTNQVSDSIQAIDDDPRHLRILHWDVINLINFCRENNIRILHYHFSIFHMPIMKLIGFKTIYTIHNAYVWFNEGAWMRTKSYLKFCDKIVAVSDFAKDYFVVKSGIKKVEVVLNGINLDRFIDQNTKTPITRDKLGVSKKDKVLVNVAAFNEQKYQLSLVGAMEEIIKKRPDIKLVLIGPVGDKKLYKHIVKVIDKSSANKNIIITGSMDQHSLAAFLKEVPDGFVLPSIYEAGVPLVVFEALASGLPVAMTDLSIDKFPFAEHILTFSPPYDDIHDLTSESVAKMVRQKKSHNQAEMIEKMLYLVDKSREIKPNISIDKLREAISIDAMTSKYLDLMGLAENEEAQ